MNLNKRQVIRQILFVYIMAFLLVALRAYAQSPQDPILNKTHIREGIGAIRQLHPKKPILQKKAFVAGKIHRRYKKLYALLDTSMGKIKIRLFDQIAPKTVENFVGLADGTKEFTDPKTHKKVKRHFYNGLTFHRIIAGFMIQGGDPLGNGMGGPGYTFKDEISNEVEFNRPGIVAMANSGPNTNGSQFFITVSPQPHLDGKYTIFGEVTEGMDVVYAISKVKTDAMNKPLKPVIIESVKILHN